jgi:hypothetical protein
MPTTDIPLNPFSLVTMVYIPPPPLPQHTPTDKQPEVKINYKKFTGNLDEF